jgi:ABC-type phosphate transport system substrate-binding protein
MRARKLSVGIGVVSVAMSVFALMPTAAFADYAPSSDDVVGVGSDTLQQGVDFVADGDHLGDAGYNAGQPNKFISIDATADANTRLAYGTGALSGSCAPGTGGTQGTGNANANHADNPCTLNPSVVLRAGTSPIQRPNGSGAGYNLLKADLPNASHIVDFARASSARGSLSGIDSIVIGNDPLGMLTSSTSNDKRGLTIAELKSIYECTTTNWASVGGTSGTIKPLLPQVGSGTRSYFLGAIGVTTPQGCVQNVEENDPEAIDASGDSLNAIEPMSQSRLYLFQGKLSDGTSNGVGGYFKDPSCVGLSTTAPACTTGKTLAPNVKLWTTADTAGTFYPTRPLFVYFRHADINSTKAFEPGSSLNWVRTMFYNPGGATPYICDAPGQALLSAAGIVPNPNCTTSFVLNGA